MILADSSAWIEYLRGTGSAVHVRFRRALRDRGLCTTDVVLMEVLAGARDDVHASDLERLLARCHAVPAQDFLDFQHAALLYRACRQGGETVRRMNDCLVAAVAIRTDTTVLHRDRDYEALARHTRLRLEPA